MSEKLNVKSAKIRGNKTLYAIALTIMLTFSAIVACTPVANAHSPPWNITTFAYISVFPNPVGVNQQVTVFIWVDKVWPGASNIATTFNDIRPHNYKVTITGPDNKVETKKFDINWDPTSTQYFLWYPKLVGTYTFKFDFPEQVYTWSTLMGQPLAYYNDTYLASSATTTLTVQADQLPDPVNSYPLPNEYWTRPINGENSWWWQISSDWLGTSVPAGTSQYGIAGWSGSTSVTTRYPGDAVGPLTSHIMWTKPLQAGGVVGGDMFPVEGDTYFEGSAYINRYTNPIVVNGKIYYTEPLSFAASGGPVKCVDLRTGELIWSRTDIPTPSFAYMYDVQWVNNHGVYPPILFTSNFARAFDAETGNPLFNVTNVPSGTTIYGQQGEILKYVFTNVGTPAAPDYRLAQWNSSKMWTYTGLSPSIDTNTTTTWAWSNVTTYVNNSRTVTSTNVSTATVAVNANVFNSSDLLHNRYDWNVSVPWRNTLSGSLTVIAAYYNDIMICRNGSLPTFNTQTPYTYFAVNLNKNKGEVGSVLWRQTYNPVAGNITVYNGGADSKSRIFLEMYKETMQWVGYSMENGAQVWGPTESQAAQDYFGQPFYPILGGQIAYGKLYSSAYAGIVYCYDMASGNLLWTYGNGGPGNSTSGGFQIPYGRYPTFIAAVGNGKVYTVTTEHTVSTPIYKGAKIRCIDAETGAEIWTLEGYTGSFSVLGFAIADGFANYFNGYDNQIYTVGKGPSAITVDAPMASITQGSSLMIRGSVTDISAGTKQNEQAARFPHGVPAISDANMSLWMEYVYMQRPFPSTAKGVDVKITIIDPNYNTHEVTATSDSLGQYSIQWTPPVAGKYYVIAKFEGSQAYWPSTAETAFGVDPAAGAPTAAPTPTLAPTATPTATPTTAPTASPSMVSPPPGYGLGTEYYIAIAAVIIIIAIAAVAVILRRRK